jgi:hypothetical protein
MASIRNRKKADTGQPGKDKGSLRPFEAASTRYSFAVAPADVQPKRVSSKTSGNAIISPVHGFRPYWKLDHPGTEDRIITGLWRARPDWPWVDAKGYCPGSPWGTPYNINGVPTLALVGQLTVCQRINPFGDMIQWTEFAGLVAPGRITLSISDPSIVSLELSLAANFMAQWGNQFGFSPENHPSTSMLIFARP